MKKNNKDIKEYEIPFYGVAKSKGYTYEDARNNLEKTNNIDSISPIKTDSILNLIGKGILSNTGAVMTTLAMIIMIIIWGSLLQSFQILEEPFNVIGILILAIFMVETMRFPKIIGNWFYR